MSQPTARGELHPRSAVSAPAVPLRRSGQAISAAASSRHPPLPRSSGGTRQTTEGRVYSLTQHVPTPEENLTGTAVIFVRQARTIFDTGASHSFISFQFVTTHGFAVQPNRQRFWVEIPSHSLLINEEFYRCPIRLGERVLHITLFVRTQASTI